MGKQYYSLPIEIFKNSLDNTLLELLWNKYWIDTLSSSPLLHNRGFCNQMVQDTVQKMGQIDMAAVSSRASAWRCTRPKSGETRTLSARSPWMQPRMLGSRCRGSPTKWSSSRYFTTTAVVRQHFSHVSH